MTAPIPLSRQISAIECLQDEGDFDALQAAVKTLRLFRRFEDEIRAKLLELLAAERERVMADPAVKEVMSEFPGARVEIGGT
jgi:ribosomal 50S subunit-associated protein YjgA (DUF615 family)